MMNQDSSTHNGPRSIIDVLNDGIPKVNNISAESVDDFLYQIHKATSIFDSSMTLHDLFEKIDFNACKYIDEKTKQIHDFFVENNIKSCIIPLSGGVDSALTAILVAETLLRHKTPFNKVSLVNIPVKKFTRHQEKAKKLSKYLYEKIISYIMISTYKFRQSYDEKLVNTFEFKVFDITKSTKKMYNLFSIEDELPTWEGGQLASVMRTPLLYGYNSVLTKKHGKSIIIGTINKDEEYLGFFGKASDAMVDMIFISDLHKYQVYECLSIFMGSIKIKKIFNRQPTGDCYDNRNDEEMIGGTYYDVLMSYYSNNQITKEGITKLLIENKHKHQVGRPYHKLILDNSLFTNLS